MIVVSGIQPTGELHLGNYFGAMEQQIILQEGNECFYFIADYHALTSMRNGADVREHGFNVACAYLAAGIDPQRTALFRQSDVPEVTELAWILSTVTGFGLMKRSHAFKEKVENGLEANVGLFTYPILMAADILLYGADLVPVGPDQVQHLEITKDIAAAFNSAYDTDIFKIPRHTLGNQVKVPGVDGRKMSKSYHNTIPLFLSGKKLRKIVAGIVTDGKDYKTEPLTTNDTICQLYYLMAKREDCIKFEDNYLNNREFGYGHAKQLLAETIENHFGEMIEKYNLYKNHRKEVEEILQDGAKKARIQARKVVGSARSVALGDA